MSTVFPKEANYEGWYCRKGSTAMNMQCICDHNMRILCFAKNLNAGQRSILWSKLAFEFNGMLD
jgi:hypothetical protein